jgi:Txe/YoeB family toxin of toxin-antitoxin system
LHKAKPEHFPAPAFVTSFSLEQSAGECPKAEGVVDVEMIVKQPFTGYGKPELLHGDLKGWWSRRVTLEDRLVYRVSGQQLETAQARWHY